MKAFDYNAWFNEAHPAFQKSYRKTLDKYNVSRSFYYTDQKVFLKVERFRKDGRKNFPSKPCETEYFDWGTREYLNAVTAIPFFKDRVTMGYTAWGYIPVMMTCYSPDGNEKIRRTFHFEAQED